MDPSEVGSTSDRARRALATIDIASEGFALHEHLEMVRQGDGSVVVGLPWSQLRVRVPPPDTDEPECRRQFNRHYLQLLRTSPEESLALRHVVLRAGHTPLSDRPVEG